jgi:hypothetical protein
MISKTRKIMKVENNINPNFTLPVTLLLCINEKKMGLMMMHD